MSNYCQSIECDDCRSEERDEAASVAYDNYKADLCELEMNIHEAAMKWFDLYIGQDYYSDGPYDLYKHDRGMAVLKSLDLTLNDYLRWKCPPPPDASLPF
jgi:hypothetical protein